MRSLLE